MQAAKCARDVRRWLQVFPQLTSVMVTPLVSALNRYESLKAEEDRRKVSCDYADAAFERFRHYRPL